MLSSFIGGLSSLYIFAPDYGVIFQFSYKCIICAVLALITFGYKNLKIYLRSCGVLFTVTCGYGGIMTALWYVLKPTGMTVVNSVVYFNISPTVLILSSVFFYFAFKIISHLFAKTAPTSDRCEVIFNAEGKTLSVSAIVDTGNSIEDFLGNSEIIIADKSCAEKLFGKCDLSTNENLKSRYRLLPCGTVSGEILLEGIRCDSALVKNGKQSISLNKPILAISKTPIKDDYSAIINPRIF